MQINSFPKTKRKYLLKLYNQYVEPENTIHVNWNYISEKEQEDLLVYIFNLFYEIGREELKQEIKENIDWILNNEDDYLEDDELPI